MNYSFLIYNNNFYICNLKNKHVDIIKNLDCISDDKIIDINCFLNIFSNNKRLIRLHNQLIPINVIFYCWENFDNINMIMYKDMFERVNINIKDFRLINNYFKQNTLIVSGDGVHFIGKNNLYYSYNLFGSNIINTINYIITSYQLNNCILIGNIYLDNAFMYENNNTFFEDFLIT